MIPVIDTPSAPYTRIRSAAVREGASLWYLRALVALWDAGVGTGVDPVLLAAQCAHETGFGNFGGAIDGTWGNTCGLKVRNATGDTPADHARFPLDSNGFPLTGALAHAHHLRLYCGFPAPADTPDPRAVWVGPGTVNFGSVAYAGDLGGRWAPDPDYGRKVAAVYARLVRL